MAVLTIGMATYNDYDGVYFTLQALRLYQHLDDTELLVIDNFGCEHTKQLVDGWAKASYVPVTDSVGAAAPRALSYQEAEGAAALRRDSHVLFSPRVIHSLPAYYATHPDCPDLV